MGDIFGDEVRGIHSTYNEKIKKQVAKLSFVIILYPSTAIRKTKRTQLNTNIKIIRKTKQHIPKHTRTYFTHTNA